MLGNLLGGLGGVLGGLTGAGGAAPVVWPPSTDGTSAVGRSEHGATGRGSNLPRGAARSDSTASRGRDAGPASHRMGMQRLAGNRWKVIGLIMLAALTLFALLWASKARLRGGGAGRHQSASVAHPIAAPPSRGGYLPRSRLNSSKYRRGRPRSHGDVSSSEG